MLPLVKVSRGRETALPLSSQSTSPAHRGFWWGIDELAGDIFGRDVSVIEEVDSMGDMAFNLVGMYHELALRRLCVMKMFADAGSCFACMNCSLTADDVLVPVVTGHIESQTSCHGPVLEILN